MGKQTPPVLLAGMRSLMDQLNALLGDAATTELVETHEQALFRLQRMTPALVVLAYHFDQFHAFRLIRELRGDPRLAGVPVVLVRIVPMELGAKEEEIATAYSELGADEFISLPDETRRRGQEGAMAYLKERVLSRLANR